MGKENDTTEGMNENVAVGFLNVINGWYCSVSGGRMDKDGGRMDKAVNKILVAAALCTRFYESKPYAQNFRLEVPF